MDEKDTLNLSDAATIVDSVRLQGFLPYLEAEINKLIDACTMKADQMSLAGALTPQAAAELWAELLAYRRLLRRFQGRERAAKAVRIANGPKMNLTSQ